MPDSRQHAHAHLHAQTRTRERRQRLAHEAARLMAEGGIRDFHMAKRKAAQRLGILDDASLPRNREIEDALREYQRLFLGDRQPLELRRRREAALRALEFFAGFRPRLVGPVLEGTADARSAVDLHLHSDDPDAVPRWLDEHGIPAQPRSRHLRLDRERALDAPGWLFSAEELAFDATVLPLDGLRQAPLSGIDERPMQRASAAQLRALLAEEEIRAHQHP
ncbi:MULTISPECIES: hypothetical protein [Thermomonas]|jgi:hypothetical protein|uniref:Nucleotidyltransferase n=1 Tax=Thermomonas fusca TaxID=215690 RepID=A0A5R9PIL5_9GAMM|nr:MULTISPECIES: hypothetical protein [Thermomonas]TLX23066.1 hypothetical protein E5S66_03315 [Thermomonas fusca]